MRTLKEIGGLLLLAAAIVGIGQFLPGLNVLFDDYLVGFFLAAIVFLSFEWRISHTCLRLANDLRKNDKKRKKRIRDGGKKQAKRHICLPDLLIHAIFIMKISQKTYTRCRLTDCKQGFDPSGRIVWQGSREFFSEKTMIEWGA